MQYIDSHTAGEPTRVIVADGPDLGSGPLVERVRRFHDQFDHLRRCAILEPRGADYLVGALLCPPVDTSCATGVIFFNNTGYLGMCGHGSIGVAVTLAHLGRIGIGTCRFETPVGVVAVTLHTHHEASIQNVASYRYRERVPVDVPGFGTLYGDIAYGGNWFYLVEQSPIDVVPRNLEQLTALTRRIRRALIEQRITGADGAEIDHIEVFGPPDSPDANSRNYVLCPGDQYDRSPCGTGTSAKLACLAAAGKLAPGASWTQESIIGSRFTASYQWGEQGRVVPTITGSAYICGQGTLLAHEDDPFRFGIPPVGGI